jgi:hypothetical protein
MPTRARRCRICFRTLTRFWRYTEIDPVDENESVLRTIPNVIGYYNPDAPELPVLLESFLPNKKRDPDGLSLCRLDFISPKRFGRANRHGAGVYVSQIAVAKIISLGLSVKPSVIPEFPGHVIIPEMSYPELKKNKNRIKDLALSLARLASANIVYGPTPPKTRRG